MIDTARQMAHAVNEANPGGEDMHTASGEVHIRVMLYGGYIVQIERVSYDRDLNCLMIEAGSTSN